MERDEKGRFPKGVSGNTAGRPKKEREIKYMEITLNTVTFADWERIVLKARDQALKGDPVARKFLADYLIGPPQNKLDITSDGKALKGYVVISPDDWEKDDKDG